MSQFFTLLTKTGQGLLANAIAYGQPLTIATMAIGDGGGKLPTPDASTTRLINEVRRGPINQTTTDPNNPNWTVVEQVLPPDVGGWTIREVGLYDTEGNLIAYGNYPETYKPQLSEGSSRTQTIRFIMEVTDTSAVTLRIDPSVVMASREYVDKSIEAHAKSRNHPAADTKNSGMMRFATLAESKKGEEAKAAQTPAGGKAQFDAEMNKYGWGAFPADRIIGSGNRHTSCNAAVDQGVWVVNSSATDKPGGAGAGWIFIAGKNNDDYLAQSFISNAGTASRWERTRSNGNWSSWLPVVLADTAIDLPGTRTIRLNVGGSEYASYQVHRTVDGVVNQCYFGADPLGGVNIGVTLPDGAFTRLRLRNDGTLLVNDSTVWHTGNLTESTETKSGIAYVADQARVDNGSDDFRFVTAKKLAMWFSREARAATAAIRGLVRLARQDEVDNGVAADAVVSTRTLLGGAYYVAEDQGRLVLPAWLGGFMLQWGRHTVSADGGTTVTWPITFPRACYYGGIGTVDEYDNRYFLIQPLRTSRSAMTVALYGAQAGSAPIAGTSGVSVTLGYLAFGR